MENFLMKVVEHNQSAKDFSKQLCGNLNLPVTYNDKELTFDEMCNQLKQIKKRRIKLLNCSKLKLENGCITEMKVYMKKTLL